ncbi:MAG: hypothetical protein JRG90_11825 [Deltaproteobacteria bacterium]|nr:hypothetical protein [Deltaproteobacteria bacterium]
MRKFTTLLGGLAMMLALSGSANAGYWEVTYDLATSTNTTNSPAGALTDPLTGKWRFQFDSASAAAPAPYTGARMAAGTQHLTLSQVATAVVLTLTGTSDVTLLPAAGGQPAVIAGATINAFISDSSKNSGFNHCYGPVCALAGFTVGASVPIPLTVPPEPFPIPKLVFTGANAGDGSKFTSTTKTIVVGANTNIQTIYRGVEVARYYITGAVPALGGGVLAGLAAFLLIGGTSTLALRNRR